MLARNTCVHKTALLTTMYSRAFGFNVYYLSWNVSKTFRQSPSLGEKKQNQGPQSEPLDFLSSLNNNMM